jgi:hypothetical protein
MQRQINLPKHREGTGLLKTILLAMCLGISLFGWLRFSGAASIYTLLLELGIRPHPIYYLFSGLAIGLLFLLAFIGSALNHEWAGVYVRICSAMLSIHLLIEILFIRGRASIIQVVLTLAASVSFFILTSRKNKKNEFAS